MNPIITKELEPCQLHYIDKIWTEDELFSLCDSYSSLTITIQTYHHIIKSLLSRCQQYENNYSLFEELSPPDVPRKEFVKWCYDAWEKQSQSNPLSEKEDYKD